ncbi:hypothetical protein RHMOL_Rhmol12G0075200 [Rhododendron molle]|uniref:Uncharacterized protein n=1 Tax=Rhododendron molle TaxID=49168 RepID=A0ACC0LFN6_RHOML|nr:hypothetical protein RHMOL_Rhmol12G0075200 [Rhododendron molle]
MEVNYSFEPPGKDCRWMLNKLRGGVLGAVRYKPLVITVYQGPRFPIAAIHYRPTVISPYNKMRAIGAGNWVFPRVVSGLKEAIIQAVRHKCANENGKRSRVELDDDDYRPSDDEDDHDYYSDIDLSPPQRCRNMKKKLYRTLDMEVGP